MCREKLRSCERASFIRIPVRTVEKPEPFFRDLANKSCGEAGYERASFIRRISAPLHSLHIDFRRDFCDSPRAN